MKSTQGTTDYGAELENLKSILDSFISTLKPLNSRFNFSEEYEKFCTEETIKDFTGKLR